MYFEIKAYLISAILGFEDARTERVLARQAETFAEGRQQYFKWLFERRRNLFQWSVPRLKKLLEEYEHNRELTRSVRHAT